MGGLENNLVSDTVKLVHSLEGKVRNTEQGQTVLWMASQIDINIIHEN